MDTRLRSRTMSRQRVRAIFLCFLAGCSTHPVADTLDFFKPGKLGPNKVQPYGGVAIPQGPIVPAGIPAVSVPTAPVQVIPGPLPLPGSPPTTLQPPIPPPPPLTPRNF